MTQHTIEDDVVSLPDDISPAYSQDFIDFIDESTSVFHTSAYFIRKFSEAGYKQIRESEVRIAK
jgi:aspartyl aminopeptidase